jgi:hypothetical protein
VSISLSICRALATLDWLLVGLEVEVDEQAEIAREQSASEQSGTLRSCAVGNMGKGLGIIGECVMLVG